MPDYHYSARELSGKPVQGTLTAESEQEVLRQLTARALFPERIRPAADTTARWSPTHRRIGKADLAAFYGQLADLLTSGVPLLRSLEIIEQQSSRGTLRAILQEIRHDVADGTRLADAMRSHQRVFGDLAISMVRAGEEGGFLEDVLKRTAQFTEQQEDLKSRVVGAMAYPLFLLGIGSVIVTAMLVFFVPQFAPIFDRMAERGQLPLMTTWLMQFSAILQRGWFWLALVAAGSIWWVNQAFSTPAGRRAWDRLRLKLVGLGPIVRNFAIARFCRILGTLLRNGVPILPALRISKDATGNILLSEAIGKAAENITEGKVLARPLAASGQFPADIVEMIAIGEESNNLEQVLIDIADNMERRTYRRLELFVRLLEPAMLLLMAVVILLLVLALMLPVLQSSGVL